MTVSALDPQIFKYCPYGCLFDVPVDALRCYVETNAQFRQSDQLFLCYGGVKKAASVTKQRMSNWIVETITLAYKAAGKPLPWGLTCHSTRAISSSWAAFRGVSLTDICTVARCASLCIFARFYKVNVVTHYVANQEQSCFSSDGWHPS